MKTISALPLKIYLKKISKTRKVYYGFYTHSLGHVLIEFDYVYQLSRLEENSGIIIFERSQFTKEITHYFKVKGHKVSTGGFLNYLIGLNYSNVKNFVSLVSLGHEFPFIRNHKYSSLELSLKFSEYAVLRFDLNKNNTLLENLTLNNNIFKELNINVNEKYITVQIKTEKANQTIIQSNPHILLKILKTLSDYGYKIIFMGREKLPTEWQNLNIINYANSPNASFSNDLILTKFSTLNLSTASGFFLIADLLHVPSCVINVWQILWPPFDPNTTFIPQLLKQGNRIVPIYEQVQLNFKYSTHLADDISDLLSKYDPVEVELNIVLKTIRDILNNDYKPNLFLRDQVNFPIEFKSLPLNFVESKISRSFLETYPEYVLNMRVNERETRKHE
jgi:putative glycosyltransferase (TIGR04372 family)